MEIEFVLDKYLCLAGGRFHGADGEPHGIEIRRRGAARGKLSNGGLQYLAKLVELNIFDLVEQEQPLQVTAHHAVQAGLQIGAVAGAGFEQAEKDEALRRLAQRGATYSEYLSEPWLGGQASAAADVACAHEFFQPMCDVLNGGIALTPSRSCALGGRRCRGSRHGLSRQTIKGAIEACQSVAGLWLRGRSAQLA